MASKSNKKKSGSRVGENANRTPTSKKLLALEIRNALKNQGLTHQMAALKIDVNYATFRHALGKNKFDRVWLKRLLRLLKWQVSLDELKDHYELEFTEWNGQKPDPQKYEELSTGANQLSDILPKLETALEAVFGEMELGDGLCFIGREVAPKHTEDNDLLVEAATAASNGVSFVYVRPSQEALNEMLSFGMNPGTSEVAIVQDFLQFVNKVKSLGLRPSVDVSQDVPVDQRFGLVLVDSLAVFNGSEARAYHRYSTALNRRELLFARVPISSPTPDNRPGHGPDYIDAFLQLSKPETQKAGKVVQQILDRALHEPEDPEGVFRVRRNSPVSLTASLSTSQSRNSVPTADCHRTFREDREQIYESLTSLRALKETSK